MTHNPPYTVQLNAAEKIIAVIENKVRTYSNQWKYLSLKMINKIVNDIDSET